MSDKISYFAHFNQIIFPPSMPAAEDKKIPVQPAIAEKTSEQDKIAASYSDAFILQFMAVMNQAHFHFISQQTQFYHYYLQCQQQLSQHLIQLAKTTDLPFTANIPLQTTQNFPEQNPFETPLIYPVEKPHDHHFNQLPGPKFSRQDLEGLASANISTFFGDWFQPLDQYQRLIRMPQPPLLLADRVTGIDAIAGSCKRGVIWTETDVTENAWYLHQGHMPAGIMIEAGQADLLLVSWLGFDFYNRGQRIYRLLGCELTYYGELPKPGDTLCYEIHIDGHAKQGEIRLFFFHYDCKINGEVRLRVCNGQAGFFSDEELANSGGVLWDANDEKYDTALPLDPPILQCVHTKFSPQQLEQFSKGEIYACFGKGFELALTHTRTPCISGGDMQLISRITEFNPAGGPKRRGYMRAEQDVHENDWFFKGHFKNDPCMPGTLMLEAGLQVMACYLTALGFTLDKDGWRFEPMPDTTYTLRCRGQVRPHNKQVVYEIFVYSVVASPIPMIFADLMGTVDGLKAFHTKIGLRLIPDWPLTAQHPSLLNHVETKSAPVVNGFTFDYHSLLACALGKPSTAFGDLYKPFDSYRKVARLPGPPYHFISRIVNINAQMGSFKAGSSIQVEYDVPEDAWYFKENSSKTMPFCVLLEAALQPCGWLASFLGSTLTTNQDLLFRNLDGEANLFADVFPDAKTLCIDVKCTNIFQASGMIIESFEVSISCNNQHIYQMNTVFGFFPKSAFDKQVGLSMSIHQREIIKASSDFFVDLTQRPSLYCQENPHLAAPMLLMIDCVNGFWPEKGQQKLGMMRAEKYVNPADWFFKAHFFQDPVQPGSLGIEAMLQLLQFYMLQQNMHKKIAHPRFEPLAFNNALSWKYRGQVVPTNKVITVIIDIISVSEDEDTATVVADASLWVDGIGIYEAKNIGMRLICAQDAANEIKQEQFNVDFNQHPWVKDHRPNYTLPALPMMSMIDGMMAAAKKYFPTQKIISMQNIQVLRWVVIQHDLLSVYATVELLDKHSAAITLAADDMGQPKPFIKGKIYFAKEYLTPPVPPVELMQATLFDQPYVHLLSHGTAFQVLRELKLNAQGSSAILQADKSQSLFGVIDNVLLDGALHGITHDNLAMWSHDITQDQVGYPVLITAFHFYGEIPLHAPIRCETRFAGFYGSKQFPKLDITLLFDNQVIATLQLVECLFPKGPLGKLPPAQRRIFIRDKQYVEGMALSTFKNGSTHLSTTVVKNSDWLPGSIANLYDVQGDLAAMTAQIAIKEHVARKLKVHPADICVRNATDAFYKKNPAMIYHVNVIQKGDDIVVSE